MSVVLPTKNPVSAVDVFCGVGGLTHGLLYRDLCKNMEDGQVRGATACSSENISEGESTMGEVGFAPWVSIFRTGFQHAVYGSYGLVSHTSHCCTRRQNSHAVLPIMPCRDRAISRHRYDGSSRCRTPFLLLDRRSNSSFGQIWSCVF